MNVPSLLLMLTMMSIMNHDAFIMTMLWALTLLMVLQLGLA